MRECVVRMEMPKACWFCGLRFVCKDANDFMTTKEAGCSVLKVGMEGCLIVCQLPEGHGRLGDLDELAAGCDDPYWCIWLSEIEDAPTIVPAEAERSET